MAIYFDNSNITTGKRGPEGPQGPKGADGAKGPTGPAGPNEVTTATATNINGILTGDGANVSGVSVLPISKGGTGASDAAGARSSLGAVPTSRTINGKTLSSDITLTASDVSAIPTSQKGAANGVASLDAYGKVEAGQASSRIIDVTTSMTIPVSYMGTLLKVNSANAVELALPSTSNVISGAEVEIMKYGNGSVTISIQSGNYFAKEGVGFSTTNVTIPKRFGVVALKRVSSDTWLITGAYE